MNLTILLPVHNVQPHALFEAVHCLLVQDDQLDHPIILINDGCTEIGTLSMLGYLREYSKRITVIDQAHGGTSSALNAGHRRAETEYVALMGDDVCDRSRLRLQCDYLRQHPQTDVLGCNLYGFYDEDIMRKSIFVTQHKEVPTGYRDERRWVVNHGTVVYRQSAVMDAGGYQKQGRAQDVELWGRMLDKGYVFRNLTQILYGWRRFQ